MKHQASSITVQVSRLPHGADLSLPEYATPGAAGMDLRAAVEAEIELLPGRREAVPTGFCIALPQGYEAQIRPRSGLALNNGLTVLNAPGTIDSDYRGEVLVILANLSEEPWMVRRGDRIAQLVIAPVAQATWKEVDELPDSARGSGGFGHTGT